MHSDAGTEGKTLWLREASHLKGCQPPVSGAELCDHLFIFGEDKGKARHILVVHALKEGAGQFAAFDNPVSIVHADFTARINPVLALPEFNEPCSAAVVELDRQAVKDHIEMRCRPVKKGAVSEFPLPCVKA